MRGADGGLSIPLRQRVTGRAAGSPSPLAGIEAVTTTGLPQQGPGSGGRHAAAPARAGRRLYAIDGIRLVAALMVAVHHYAGTARVDRPGNVIWGRSASELMPTVFRFASYGWIGVEIFFVISGFVICMSCWGRTPKDFFVSRVIRLYPAYWVAIILTTGFLAAVPGVWERLRLREVLINFTMLQSGSGVPNVDGVYWTLWSELRFYLLFLLVVATGLTYRKVVVFCCLWGAVAMLAPVSHFPCSSSSRSPTAPGTSSPGSPST